ncbi:MAG: hypothetical protein LIP28_00555, partial [Deltaproteobacteria bacterium]|nr:hypothetical protein [Deltaproteobacteria bacterium]
MSQYTSLRAELAFLVRNPVEALSKKSWPLTAIDSLFNHLIYIVFFIFCCKNYPHPLYTGILVTISAQENHMTRKDRTEGIYSRREVLDDGERKQYYLI